jgi:hypothetical protein
MRRIVVIGMVFVALAPTMPIAAWRIADDAAAGRAVQIWSLGSGDALAEVHDADDWRGWRAVFVGSADDLVGAMFAARDAAQQGGWDTSGIAFYRPVGGVDHLITDADRTHDAGPNGVRVALYLR